MFFLLFMIDGSGRPKNIWIYGSGSGSATLVIRYLLSGWGSLSPPVLDHSQYGHRFVLGIRTPVQEQRVMKYLLVKGLCFFIYITCGGPVPAVLNGGLELRLITALEIALATT
jgi:hypothetical protein